ncbi:hypothetical protein M0K88_004706 [Escherichia coli]|nr:hypothetical protein [Escherichia coli]
MMTLERGLLVCALAVVIGGCGQKEPSCSDVGKITDPGALQALRKKCNLPDPRDTGFVKPSDTSGGLIQQEK